MQGRETRVLNSRREGLPPSSLCSKRETPSALLLRSAFLQRRERKASKCKCLERERVSLCALRREVPSFVPSLRKGLLSFCLSACKRIEDSATLSSSKREKGLEAFFLLQASKQESFVFLQDPFGPTLLSHSPIRGYTRKEWEEKDQSLFKKRLFRQSHKWEQRRPITQVGAKDQSKEWSPRRPIKIVVREDQSKEWAEIPANEIGKKRQKTNQEVLPPISTVSSYRTVGVFLRRQESFLSFP